MKYVWDRHKNAANIAKHGFDFTDAERVFEEPVIVWVDKRRNYGEERYVAIGSFEGICFTVVFTDRQGERRIISVRRSNRKERHRFSEAFEFANGLGAAAQDER